MLLIPFEIIKYKTKLTAQEVLDNLTIVLAVEKGWFFNNKDIQGKEYIGKIQGNTFDIARIIKGRDSFRPVIKGVISEDGEGALITVKMRLHFIVALPLFVFCVFIIQALIRSGANYLAGLLFIVYAMTIVFFTIEKQRSIKDLERIFKAKKIK